MTAAKRVGELAVAVVGCGSIGSRHATNLRTLGVRRLALVDLDRPRAGRLATTLGVKTMATDLGSLDAGFRPDAVLVCTPPASHLAVVEQALGLGAHVFCEKPLAPDLDGVEAVLARATGAGRLVMMGMCYRFHPALVRLRARLGAGEIGRVLGAQLRVGQYLPAWHPWADYRTEYSARRALGGGVLLDCIHALDTARWLFGGFVEVTAMLGRVSDLAIETEDVVAAVLRRGDGILVEVHLDYLQREPANRIEVIGAEGILRWDFHARQLHAYRASIGSATDETIAVEPNVMYEAELREFLECVTQERASAVDGYEGARTLALAVAVREAAHTGRHVRLGPDAAGVPEAGHAA
jgi:predicted dehydrogenase